MLVYFKIKFFHFIFLLEISECGGHLGYGVVHTREQCKAMESFCRLSHILPIYNQGWEPDYSTGIDKWHIQTINHEVQITCSYHAHHFLTFETKERAYWHFPRTVENIKYVPIIVHFKSKFIHFIFSIFFIIIILFHLLIKQ
jgi:hypothetical protein